MHKYYYVEYNLMKKNKIISVITTLLIIWFVVSFWFISLTAAFKPETLHKAFSGDKQARQEINPFYGLKTKYNKFKIKNSSTTSAVNKIIIVILILGAGVYLKKRIDKDNNKTI